MKLALVRNGMFLTAEQGGGSTVSERRPVAQGPAEWEIFTLEGRALKCRDGIHYLTFDRNGSIRATATSANTWERIAVEPVAAGPIEWQADDAGGIFSGEVVIVQADAALASALQRIHLDGRIFRHEDGTIFRYVGFSDFCLFPLFVRQGVGAIADLVTERIGLFDTNRVARTFRYAGNHNAFALDPAWDATRLDQAVAFARYMGSRGLRVSFTAGDAQLVLPNQADQQAEVNAFYEAIEGETNVDFETCNEPFKNGIDVKTVRPPSGRVLRASGSYELATWGDPTFGGTILDFVDYHSVRDGLDTPYPKAVWDPPEEMYGFESRAIVDGEPFGFDEALKPGSRSNVPIHGFKLACERLLWDIGVVFHSTVGTTGAFFRDNPQQHAAAGAFARGVRLMESVL